MAYIGKTPTVGNFVKLDAITASATASYTMQVDSVNFSPESVNHMLVSLNGVIQAPTTSYTISGSTITFASALTSSDSIDFIMVYGNVLDIGTPSDATVTKAKTNFVSSGTGYTGTGLDIKGNGSANGRLGLLCSAGSHGVAIESPDHSAGQSYTMKLPDNQIAADKFLKVKSISGSGNTAIGQLEFADAGGVGGTESFYVSKTGSADQTLTNQTYTKITFDSEGVDVGNNFASDKYTVPSAGKYFFEAQVKGQSSTDSKIQIFVTAIYKNGTMVVRNHNELTAGYEKMISKNLSVILDLATNDYIEVYCYLGQAGSTTLSVKGDSYGATHFLGYKLA